MTKCTLCVDRIYSDSLEPRDRQPACVKACPTGARLLGDVKNIESEVSKALGERGGCSLMPDWDARPANQYLPRRPTASVWTRPSKQTSWSTAKRSLAEGSLWPGSDYDGQL